MGLSGTAITPVAAFTADIYPPASGTAVLAADVEAGLQNLANRWAWLLAQPRLVAVEHYGADDAASAHGVLGTLTLSGSFANGPAFAAAGPFEAGDLVEIVGSVYVQTDTNAPVWLRLGDTTESIAVDNCIPESLSGWFNTWTQVQFHAWYVVDSSHLPGIALYLQARGNVGAVATFAASWTAVARTYRNA